MKEKECQNIVLDCLEKLAETIWNWMYSWEEVRRHILQQRDNMRDLYSLINKKWN